VLKLNSKQSEKRVTPAKREGKTFFVSEKKFEPAIEFLKFSIQKRIVIL
jgi:hypothetical protein